MSRTKAEKLIQEKGLSRNFTLRVYLSRHSDAGIAEEAPDAYKDVVEVVESVEKAGIAKIVARLKPLIGIKG